MKYKYRVSFFPLWPLFIVIVVVANITSISMMLEYVVGWRGLVLVDH